MAEPDYEAMTAAQRKRATKPANKPKVKLTAEQKAANQAKKKAREEKAAKKAADAASGRARVNAEVPDSSLGDNAFFDKSQYYLDDARLDPENDPTLKPLVDAIQREALEDYRNSVADLTLQAEGASRYGRDYYMSALGRANEEHNEAVQGTLANLYNTARARAEENRLATIGLGNQRDIAAGQIKAQKRGDTMSYNAQMAGIRANERQARAALGFERQKWNTEAPLRYLTAMTGIMGELNDMGGYNLSPGFVADPRPANTLSGGAIAAASLANGASTYFGLKANDVRGIGGM